MGVYTATLGTARSTATGGSSGASFATLLPTDGARAAELRNHPRSGDVLGEGLAQKLRDMPDGLTRRIEDACDEGPGMP